MTDITALEAQEQEKTRSWRDVLLVAVCAVLAFKSALAFQQVGTFLAMKAAGCPDASLRLGFGPGSPQAGGIASCTDAQTLTAGAVGCVAGLLLAVPLLFVFMSGRAPRSRPVGLFLYLLAVGSLAEVLSGTVVFGFLGRYEAGELVSAGIPAWLIVGAGVVVGLALARPVHSTSPQLADLAGRSDHADVFRKAVWFKLTVGVAILSCVRLLVAP